MGLFSFQHNGKRAMGAQMDSFFCFVFVGDFWILRLLSSLLLPSPLSLYSNGCFKGWKVCWIDRKVLPWARCNLGKKTQKVSPSPEILDWNKRNLQNSASLFLYPELLIPARLRVPPKHQNNTNNIKTLNNHPNPTNFLLGRGFPRGKPSLATFLLQSRGAGEAQTAERRWFGQIAAKSWCL